MALPSGTRGPKTIVLNPFNPLATGSDTAASLAPIWTALAAALR
jgi:hypothetical protein